MFTFLRLAPKIVLVNIATPDAFSELGFRPEAFKQLDPRLLAIGMNDGDDIVAVLHFREAEDSTIDPRSPDDLSLLLSVYGRGGIQERVRLPGLDLDETKHVSIQRNYVYLPRDRDAPSIASDRNPEVCENQNIAACFEKPGGDTFAEAAKIACSAGPRAFILV